MFNAFNHLYLKFMCHIFIHYLMYKWFIQKDTWENTKNYQHFILLFSHQINTTVYLPEVKFSVTGRRVSSQGTQTICL